MPENNTYFIEQWSDEKGVMHHSRIKHIYLLETTLRYNNSIGLRTDCYFIIKLKSNKA